MIARTRIPAASRRPVKAVDRATLRRRAMCQLIAVALFGGGIAHAATPPPAFSPAWMAAKQGGVPRPASPQPGGANAGNVSFTPGNALLQQRVQQSIQNLNTAAAAVAAQMQAQKDAQNAAQQIASTVPNGLVEGGLKPSAGIDADPSLWQNAKAPTDTVAGGKHTVEVKQSAKKAILTWDSFNVGRDTTLYFNQSAGNQNDGKNDWIALNRVNDPSADPSRILGKMKAEGTVYLLNRNGVIFGAGSQVNTHSLIASSLNLFSDDLAQSNDRFMKGGVTDGPAVLLSGSFTDGLNHDVVIEKGASITSGAQGFVLVAAPNVANAGSIVADDGQAILAATTRLNTKTMGPLEIFDISRPESSPSNTLVNTGIVQARRGSVELHGLDVVQSGVVLASTSIAYPGSIAIFAGLFQDVSGSANFVAPGTATFGNGSVTAVLPEKDGSTTSSSAAADKAFVTGGISVTGGNVDLRSGSLFEAPGGKVSLVAVRRQGAVDTDTSRIYIDDGAIIDVSGLPNVELPISALLVTIPRVGQNELANSPLLRNSFLYTQKDVVVDSSVSGTRADGLDWIGSPILNVGGYVENVPRDVSQMLTKGGSISLDAPEVIARGGSQLNLDGGYVAYQPGWIVTPNLVGADGRIHNIAQADPDVDYLGFAGQYTQTHARWGVSETYTSPLIGGTRRWDPGFVRGSDAGQMTVKASDALVLDGDISAQAFAGDRQVGDGTQPDGGRFIFGGDPASINPYPYRLGLRLQESSLLLDERERDFVAATPWETVLKGQECEPADEADLRDWLVLSTETLGKGGFAHIDITSPSAIFDAAGSFLTVQPGGSVSLTGSRIDVFGAIDAPAGRIVLTTRSPAPAPGPESDVTTSIPADITIGTGASLNVRGLWINDTGLSPGSLLGDRYVDGGSIGLLTQQARALAPGLDVDGTGNIDVQTGTVLDVSGGGYVDTDGRVRQVHGVPEGRAGDISIRSYVAAGSQGFDLTSPPAKLEGGKVSLDGSILGYGFEGGGNFTLQASEIRIGGDRSELVNANGLWLDASFFKDQGFDNYSLHAITDGTVTEGTQVSVERANFIADLDALRLVNTGADLYGSGAVTIGRLDPYSRWSSRNTADGHGPGFSLSAGDYLLWALNSLDPTSGTRVYDGLTGSVLVANGASIDVDAQGTVSLRGTQATIVHGSIRTPSGTIDVGTQPMIPATPLPKLTTRVWIGSDATLDASGIALIDPLASPGVAVREGVAQNVVPRTGALLDGGHIALETNSGYVVAEKGALLDVSGASDRFDVPVASARLGGASTDYASMPVWSDGGGIGMFAAAGLLSDATLRARGGEGGKGGSLTIGGEENDVQPGLPKFPLPTGILIQQTGGFVPSGAAELGQIEDGAPSGVLHLAADDLAGSGVADLMLGGQGDRTRPGYSLLPVGFSGDVNLSLDRSVVVKATSLEAFPAGTATFAIPAEGYGGTSAKLRLSAPYVSLLGVGTSGAFRAGDGTLDIAADTIDIGGRLSLDGWSDTTFAAAGDVRFIAPATFAYDRVGAPVTGALFSTGNLTFAASQLYPVTDYRFAVIAHAAGTADAQGQARETTVTILPNGTSQAPLSAGGSLLLDADHIEQGGTVRAPSGSLVLGVNDPAAQAVAFGLESTPYAMVKTSSIHLAPGSLTSVSLDGSTVPYGTTTDGDQWRYNPVAAVPSSDLTAPPPKEVALHGDAMALDAGATIDLSGGGSLQASEWVPGTGGTRDVLAQNAATVVGAANSGAPQYADGRAIYAILPGKQSPVSAYDAAFVAQGADAPDLGRQIYLSGTPDLPAGYYTLLPARYAELAGAYRVVQDTSATNSVLGRSTRQPDGTYAVTGYFGDALTGTHDALNSTFLVQSRDTWTQYSQYTFTDADTYFGNKASKAGIVAPRLTADAGRLTIDAGSSLDLGLALAGAPAKGGRSSQVDITGDAIQIVGADEPARDGYLTVTADGLTQLGAGSLLIGGTRSGGDEGDLVDSTAYSVLLSNDAAHPLSGQELILVARGDANATGIELASGSLLAASGSANPVGSQSLVFGVNPGKDASGNATAAVAGDGAMLRVSQNGTAPVIRHQIIGLDGAPGVSTGNLSIDAGATVLGGSALTLDATGPMHVSEDASFSAKAIDASANRIAFVGAGRDAGDDGLVIGPNTLNLFRGADEVVLRSRGEMDFLGDLDISLDHALTLDAGVLLGDGGNVSVAADRLVFGNALGAPTATAATSGGGRFDAQAGEIDFGPGAASLRGFDAFSATATRGMLGQGAGGIDFGNATVDLGAPLFLADTGASTTIRTAGALSLRGTGGTPFTRDTLGGRLAFEGASVDVGMNLRATAGNVSLHATQGDAHVAAGTTLDVGGIVKQFIDTKAFAPGGNLSIVADHGAATLDAGSTLKFNGGQEGGDAGSLTVSAGGVVGLGGTLDGHAKDGYRGGYFSSVTGGAVNLDALNRQLADAGVTGLMDITSASGDLALSAGTTLRAGRVYLYANGGSARIDGTVDTSGPVGGRIELYGRDGVDVEGRLLANSTIDEQRGGDVVIGTTGKGSVDDLDPTYGYELVQRADAGAIHISANAQIDVSGGSTAPIAGGRISFRAPLLADGDVPIQIDNARQLTGARDVTIEPYAVWSTADKGTNAAQHFDGIVDPAGWYTHDATTGKPVLVAGTWTNAAGVVLDPPADDAALKAYLSKNFFTPTEANADHQGFFGYAGGKAANGPGTLMDFIETPPFAFGGRYSAIANIHVRPGVELDNPADATGVDGGAIRILTNWNLGAGTTDADGRIALAYRYGSQAPVLTFRAGGDIDVSASISDGFYQQNTGAVLANPVEPTEPTDPTDPTNPPPQGDNGYGDAVLAYQQSLAYMDANDIWNNGNINLKSGGASSSPDGTVVRLQDDPNWQPLAAPLTQQSASYYANYKSYIDEIGDGTNQKWAYTFQGVNSGPGFLVYAPSSDGAPSPADSASYVDYVNAYESWLENNFFNVSGFRDATPVPLMQPLDQDYKTYSDNYGVYIGGHFNYYTYVSQNVGEPSFFGTQLFYAPFAPRSDDAVHDAAYDKALASYQSSLSYVDGLHAWNNGLINLKTGEQADLHGDPNWVPVQAPLTGQSANYYGNYGLYIGDIGDGSVQGWAKTFADVNSGPGFLPYAPTADGAPTLDTSSNYADYVSAYQAWLQDNFFNVNGFRNTTPVPLMQPLDVDYTAYTANYATYINGHTAYYQYVSQNVGEPGFFGTQLFYAPFAPNANLASSGSPAYDKALVSYQSSLSYVDGLNIWDNGLVNLKTGAQADLHGDPNWVAVQAPLKDQSANYYTNYNLYIGDIGDGSVQGWAKTLADVNNGPGFLAYSPNADGAPVLDASSNYADYVTAYQTWLQDNFFNVNGFRETTPVPLMQPLDVDYTAYTANYATYINGHTAYYQYVSQNVGEPGFFGTQLFYAPFAPNANAAPAGTSGYDKALSSYQSSLSYVDGLNIWDNGLVNLKTGAQADLHGDPNWVPVQAPLKDQSANYYTNYNLYIGDIGNGSVQGWAKTLADVNNGPGFLAYSPNSAGVPVLDASSNYADYVTAYQTWLQDNFFNVNGFRETTPVPLMQPVDSDYSAYTANYATYINGHTAYYQYVSQNVGEPGFFGTQLFYAPFAPGANAGTPGSGGTIPIPVAAADNSPSNMPSLGNPVPFASATLLGGNSSSFRFVAGADLGRANPLAVQAAGAGSVQLDGHFEVKDSLTDPNVVDPRSKFAGKTLLFPTTIRTGTGSIDIASALDIRWLDGASPTVIYTAGAPSQGTTAGTDVSVMRPAVIVPGSGDTLPDMLVSGLVNPDGAGDIRLSAGGAIDAMQNPIDADGAVTKGPAGSSLGQYWWQWMQTGNAADGSRSSINFANFAQGIMSAGGNVSVAAGGDISELSVSLPTTWYADDARDAVTTVGGGNLDVHAGGDILSGNYFVARGRGDIRADGSVATSQRLSALPVIGASQGTTMPVATIIALQGAQISVDAKNGVDLGGVYNPSYYSNGSLFPFILPAGHADNQPYSTDSSLDVSSTTGDIVFGSLKAPASVFGTISGLAGPVLPATLSMTALDGGIDVRTDGALYPSASGTLSLLATGDIGFSRQTIGDSTGTAFGLIDKAAIGDSPLGSTLAKNISFDASNSAFQHDQTSLHADDHTPVKIYSLDGDIVDGITAPNGFNYLSLIIAPAKQAMIYAGRDIVNLSLVGQHTHGADISRVVAGRDIYDTAYLPGGPWSLYILNGYALAPSLLLGGPGSFLVEAGRDIGPLTNEQDLGGSSGGVARSLTGIQSVGNLYNSYLPHEGADVNVAFGVGPGFDTAGFLSRYLDNSRTADGFGSLDADLVDFMQRRLEGRVVDTGYAQDKIEVNLTAAQARTLLAQEPEYVQRLFAEQALFTFLAQVGSDYNDAGSPFAGKYARGYEAIDRLFPSNYGYTANGAGDGGLNGAQTPVDTGDLDIRSTTIQTQQGGNLTVVGPGGQARVGSTAAPSQINDINGNVIAGPNTMGLLTLEKGDINLFTDRSVLLAQSRIFTEQGGDLTIWSSNGDINAGQGAKTTAEIPPPTYVCDVDAWCRVDARGQVSGAGIATLQTVEGAEPGDVRLVAPRGTVDAGDAGIRVSGDIVIAAARVANADNIQVKGESIGIPAVAAVNVGALNAASAAASAATKAAEDVTRQQQSDARDRMPSIISVNVLRDGDNGASLTPKDQLSPVSVLGAGSLDRAGAGQLTPEERRHLR